MAECGSEMARVESQARLIRSGGCVKATQEFQRRGKIEVLAGTRRIERDGLREAGHRLLVQTRATADDAHGIEGARLPRPQRQRSLRRPHRLVEPVQARQPATELRMGFGIRRVGRACGTDRLDSFLDAAGFGRADAANQEIARAFLQDALRGRTGN